MGQLMGSPKIQGCALIRAVVLLYLNNEQDGVQIKFLRVRHISFQAI